MSRDEDGQEQEEEAKRGKDSFDEGEFNLPGGSGLWRVLILGITSLIIISVVVPTLCLPRAVG